MSGKLVSEVLENAPADLTSAQMLVLVSLAEDARDNTRTATFETSLTDLCRRTRCTSGTVRNALSELSRRGLIKPQHKAHKGLVQHYYLAPLSEHHRAAITNPGGVRSVTDQ